MNNIYPTTDFDMGFTGQLPMPMPRDVQQNQPAAPTSSNLSRIAASVAAPQQSTLEPQMKFGGVVGTQGNPGADILNRATGNAERLWQSYKQPINPQVTGPSNDQKHLENYFDMQNKGKLADAALIKAEQDASTKGWTIQQVTDPNDPTKMKSIRVHAGTGKVEPLEIGGVMTNKTNPKEMQAQIDREAQGEDSRQNALRNTEKSLKTIEDLMTPEGQLTDEAKWAVGGSSLGNMLPLYPGRKGSNKIDQLQKQQVLSLITELKEKSRTGSIGMGNMSNKDLTVIEKAASLLDKAGTEEEFQKQLGILRTELQDISKRLQAEPVRNTRSPQTGNVTQAGPTVTATPVTPPSTPPAPGYTWQRRADNRGWTQVKTGGQ